MRQFLVYSTTFQSYVYMHIFIFRFFFMILNIVCSPNPEHPFSSPKEGVLTYNLYCRKLSVLKGTSGSTGVRISFLWGPISSENPYPSMV